MELWDALADERRSIADLLDGLTPEQWQVQSLCAAWDVRQLVAHLVVPLTVRRRELALGMIRSRGSVDRLMVDLVADRAALAPAELVALLRDRASRRFAPPVVGVLGPYTDLLVHQQDLLIPLGMQDERPPARWRPSLDFLMSPRARLGFLASAKPTLTYRATDLDWQHGTGDVVSGPAAAIALALLGRTPRLDELDGPGSPVLAVHAAR